MKRILMVVMASMAMALMVGCATVDTEDRGRIAVTYGVLKLIEQSDSIDGDRVISTVERIRLGVGESDVVRPEALTEVVMAQLDFDGLSTADQFLIQSVIGQVQLGLLDDVDAGVLPDDYAARLSVWLDWIEAAAYMAGGGR